MKAMTIEPIRLNPGFDLETVMLMSGQKRMQSDQARRLEAEWFRLQERLKGFTLSNRRTYLLIYLLPELEEEIEAIAREDSARGEELETLARSLIMLSFMEKVPQAGFGSCAPVPEPNKRLIRAVQSLGLEFSGSGLINVRFGLLTRLPYDDDCGGCFIRSRCAKRLLSS